MFRRISLAFSLLFAASLPALAQGSVRVCYMANPSVCTDVSPTNPLPVNATVTATATFAGFTPTPAYATLTATASSADTALPSGVTVAAFNTGTSAVSCILAVGAGTATASKNIIQPGSWLGFTVDTNTHMACINQAGDSASNVVVLTGGAGTLTGAGGGGGGGSGGSVTQGTVPWVVSNGGTFAVQAAQSTAANFNATVVGTGTFATQATLANETTKVIGTVNQGTSPWVVSNGGTFAVQAAQSTAANFNATVVGTGTFATQATLANETTKVIGTVNQGTSPWVVSNGGTFAVQAAQSTAANFNATVVGTGTFATQATLANETTKVIGTVNQGTSPWVSAGNQSNAAGGTTGSANIGVNAYLYGWTGSGWSQGIINNNGSAVSANSSPVVIASDNALPSGWKGQAAMTGSVPVVLANNQAMADPCTYAAKTNVAISMTGTTTIKLVSLAASQKIYICALNLRASAATVWSIVDGTKTTTECDTAAEAVIGATTATHGLSETANGGNAYGNGNGTTALTNTAAHDLCLFQSGSGDLSGNMTYVQRVP